MESKIIPLDPEERVIKVKGAVQWNDSRRRIEIKRPIRDKFTDLNDRSQRILYELHYIPSKKEFLKIAKEIEQGELHVPILLFLHKEVI